MFFQLVYNVYNKQRLIAARFSTSELKKQVDADYILNKKTINVSTIAVILIFLDGHLSEASVIDSKYIKMTGLQDFY